MLRAQLAKEAGSEQLRALADWLYRATHGEIAQDVQQLLAQLRLPKADLSGEP